VRWPARRCLRWAGMTVASAQMRGAASVPVTGATHVPVSDTAPSTMDPGRIVTWPLRPPRRVAGLPVGLLVCWQLAIGLGLGAVGRPVVAAVALASGAGACLAVSSWRVRGRWGYDWIRLWFAYRLRRRRLRADTAATPDAGGLALALLRFAARVEDIDEVEVDSADTAIVRHAAGLTAVLELSADGVVPRMLDLPTTLLPEQVDGEPGYAIQLVMHIRPVPAGWASRAWLAIEAFQEAGRPDAALRHALVATIRRTRRTLKRCGYPAPPLSRTRLQQDIRVAAQLDVVGPPPGAAAAGQSDGGAAAVEYWHRLWTPGLSHQTLRVRSWRPPGIPPEELATTMLTADGLGTTVALAARRMSGRGTIALEFAVRVTDRSETALATAVQNLYQELAAAGATAERLDGRAAGGLATTLPLGGFAV
jgi:hypothetical protein